MGFIIKAEGVLDLTNNRSNPRRHRGEVFFSNRSQADSTAPVWGSTLCAGTHAYALGARPKKLDKFGLFSVWMEICCLAEMSWRFVFSCFFWLMLLFIYISCWHCFPGVCRVCSLPELGNQHVIFGVCDKALWVVHGENIRTPSLTRGSRTPLSSVV